MSKFKKILTSSLLSVILCICFASNVLASSKDVLKLDLEEAVITGIENSILLDQVLTEIDLSDVSQKRASYTARKLDRGRRDLRDSIRELNIKEREFEQIKDTLPEEVATQMENQFKIARQQINQGSFKILDALQEAGATISDQLNFASLDSLNLEGTKDLLTTMADVSLEVTKASYEIYKNNIAMLIQKSYYDTLHSKKC